MDLNQLTLDAFNMIDFKPGIPRFTIHITLLSVSSCLPNTLMSFFFLSFFFFFFYQLWFNKIYVFGLYP